METGEKGKAKAVRWEPKRRYRDRGVRGTSRLRTSRAAWSDRRIVREYCRLADIEATFRVVKAELGLRSPRHR